MTRYWKHAVSNHKHLHATTLQRKPLRHALCITALLWSGGSIASSDTVDCQLIVEDTISELRIGASGWWNEDTERMAGMAAMTACFKVVAMMDSSSIESEASVIDKGSSVAGSANASPDKAQGEETQSRGLIFRPLSGSPSKKPYERARKKPD